MVSKVALIYVGTRQKGVLNSYFSMKFSMVQRFIDALAVYFVFDKFLGIILSDFTHHRILAQS